MKIVKSIKDSASTGGSGGGGDVSSVFGRTGDVIAATSDYDASQVDVTPVGGISSTNVQAALQELDTEKAASSHSHSASDITSGTFDNARISESNVTQHESAIDHDALLNFNIAEHRVINDIGTDVTDLWSASKISSELSGKADSSHSHSASDITSGTFDNARISEGNVTQHESAIDHDALVNFDIAEHRVINDVGTSTTELWSASKINSELSGKASSVHTHTASDITSGSFENARIAESNVTQHEGAINHDALTNFVENEHIDWTAATQDLDTTGSIKTDILQEHTPGSGVTVDGVLLKDGTVDGRDVSIDGTKLDGIENGAEVNDVSSVFGRTGAITAEQTDYEVFSQGVRGMVPGFSEAQAGRWLRTDGWTAIPVAPVALVFGRSGSIVAESGDYSASLVDFTPIGDISSTDVQAAIAELESGKQATLPMDDANAIVHKTGSSSIGLKFNLDNCLATRTITMPDQSLDLTPNGANFAGSIHTHDFTHLVGTAFDSQIAESSVTQHESAIDHDALTNFVQDEHLLPMKGMWYDVSVQAVGTSYSVLELDTQLSNTGQFTHDAANESVTVDESRTLTLKVAVDTTKVTATAARQITIDIEIDTGSGFGLLWRFYAYARVISYTATYSDSIEYAFSSGDKVRVRTVSNGADVNITKFSLSFSS